MDSLPKNIEEVSYTLILPRDLHTRLKTMCASKAISIKDYLTALIELDLEHNVLQQEYFKK